MSRDARLRRAEQRAHSEGGGEAYAALLRERVRAGELTSAHVELAASLGREGALVLMPGAEVVDWTDQGQRRGAITAARDLLEDRALPTRVAADWAERALHVFEADHPGDMRPREAIAAARAWAADPSEETRASARGAGDAAWAAAAASAGAAAGAAYAAAAARAADATARAAEREWQRLRLAAYVLKELP